MKRLVLLKLRRRLAGAAAAAAVAVLGGCAGMTDQEMALVACVFAPSVVGCDDAPSGSSQPPSPQFWLTWQDAIGRKAESLGVHTVIRYDMATDGAISIRSDGAPDVMAYWPVTIGSDAHGELVDFEAGWIQVTSAGRTLPGHPGLAYANNHYPSNLRSSPFLDIKDSTTSYGGLVTPTIAVVANPYKLGWNYQTFGIWDSSGNLGLESFGKTSYLSTSVPASGNATFTGELAGFYVSSSGKGSIAAAKLTVTADFAARSLSFASTGTTLTTDLSNAVAAPELNLAGTLTYAAGGTAFNGTLGNAGGTMSGKSYGTFYGPAAQELGGIFTVKSSTTAETLAGAYGAKR